MSQARLFLACLACALTAMDAAAGPSDPRNPKASQFREDDYLWQWLNGMRSVKIRLARMSAGSDGVVAYEMSEMLSENLLAMSDLRASLEGRVTGSGVAIPATLVTDSLAAALSGDGRGEGRNRPPAQLVRNL
ncbi:MAG: hypothetical protein ACYC67_19160 [Prosthecobacter sp.]